MSSFNATVDHVRVHMTDKADLWTPKGSKIVVTAITCHKLKTLMRGWVYQDQARFCDQILALGFAISWCKSLDAWVVHDKIVIEQEKSQ